MKSESDENVTVNITDAYKEKDEVTRSIKDNSEESKFGRVLERLSWRSKKKGKKNEDNHNNGEVSEATINESSKLNESNYVNGDNMSMRVKTK